MTRMRTSVVSPPMMRRRLFMPPILHPRDAERTTAAHGLSHSSHQWCGAGFREPGRATLPRHSCSHSGSSRPAGFG
ncbi:hypothetical protein ACFFX0_13570 [Citricoccus parietis]|uniref:Uncharacterized protein n=1 Tax=Citricoccus parietis TaxID=592307 RepID=A0ABV5FZS1_9MICC